MDDFWWVPERAWSNTHNRSLRRSATEGFVFWTRVIVDARRDNKAVCRGAASSSSAAHVSSGCVSFYYCWILRKRCDYSSIWVYSAKIGETQATANRVCHGPALSKHDRQRETRHEGEIFVQEIFELRISWIWFCENPIVRLPRLTSGRPLVMRKIVITHRSGSRLWHFPPT